MKLLVQNHITSTGSYQCHQRKRHCDENHCCTVALASIENYTQENYFASFTHCICHLICTLNCPLFYQAKQFNSFK